MHKIIKIDQPKNGAELATFFSMLATIPEAVVWLQNFDSPNTRQTYQNAVADCMAFLKMETPEELYALEQVHLIAWRHNLKQRGFASRSVNNRLSALSSLFKHLFEKQIVPHNPVEGVKRKRVDQTTVETPALSRAQVRAFLDAPDASTIAGARDSALFHLFAYSGCRISEPSKLKVANFHMDRDYWVLDFTVKGGKKNRLAIHIELQIALRRYLTMAGHHNNPDAFIFQRYRKWKNYDGAPIARLQIDRIFRKYARIINLPQGFSVHSFRAAFITEALEHDHPAEAVQRSVAHSSITTTLAYDKRNYSPRMSASFAVNY